MRTITPPPPLSDTWIKGLWKFAAEKEIQVKETVTANPILRWEQDAFIMERVITSGTFSQAELQHINRCRMYLQAIMLADIAT